MMDVALKVYAASYAIDMSIYLPSISPNGQSTVHPSLFSSPSEVRSLCHDKNISSGSLTRCWGRYASFYLLYRRLRMRIAAPRHTTKTTRHTATIPARTRQQPKLTSAQLKYSTQLKNCKQSTQLQ